MWIESNKLDLTRIAGDPRIVFLVQHQLQVPRNKDDLLKNPALRELRIIFEINKDQFGKASFFIIAPDFINIASMGDKNIGSKNRIASQTLDLLNKAFKGETVMVPPIWADVDSASSSGNKVDLLPAPVLCGTSKKYSGPNHRDGRTADRSVTKFYKTHSTGENRENRRNLRLWPLWQAAFRKSF